MKIPHFYVTLLELKSKSQSRETLRNTGIVILSPKSLLAGVCVFVCMWVLGPMGGVLQCGGQSNSS